MKIDLNEHQEFAAESKKLLQLQQKRDEFKSRLQELNKDWASLEIQGDNPPSIETLLGSDNPLDIAEGKRQSRIINDEVAAVKKAMEVLENGIKRQRETVDILLYKAARAAIKTVEPEMQAILKRMRAAARDLFKCFADRAALLDQLDSDGVPFSAIPDYFQKTRLEHELINPDETNSLSNIFLRGIGGKV